MWGETSRSGKVTALLMFKNEEANIPTFMTNIRPFVDEVLGYDDNSSDESATLFLQNGGKLIHFTPNAVWSNGGENQIRQALLREGRRQGGQFFIVLDCDETFNENFSKFFCDYLQVMKPGQSLKLMWVNLWGSEERFCSSDSVWQPTFREFVFRDDPTLNYGSGGLHSFGRVPKAQNDFGSITVPQGEGVVLHSQFVNWEKVQLKQVWYRLQEWLYTTQTAYAINKKYRITLDRDVETIELPPHWRPKTVFQILNTTELIASNWHLAEIERIIHENGIKRLKKLDIWNSEIMSNIWRQHFLVAPRPSRVMGVREFAGFCLWYLKKMGKQR
jgi:hypothetical protein